MHHGGGGRIENNEVWDTELAGIELSEGSNAPIVRNNLVHHCRGAGIFVQSGVPDGVIEHNTIEVLGEGSGILVSPGSQVLLSLYIYRVVVTSCVCLFCNLQPYVNGNDIRGGDEKMH